MNDARALSENPFAVLGCAPDATRAEVERAGQKLLGLLEIGAKSARSYRSPLGEHERTTDLVRAALAELRDPDRRIVHELWARATATAVGDAEPLDAAEAVLGWRDP